VWPVGIGLHVPHWPDRRIRTIIVEMGLDGPLKIVSVRPFQQMGVAQIVKSFWSIQMPPGGSRKDGRKRMVSKKRKDCKEEQDFLDPLDSPVL